MTNRDTRETRDVLKAMERKANSPKKAEIQKKRFEEASTAMQRLTLTAGKMKSDMGKLAVVYYQLH